MNICLSRFGFIGIVAQDFQYWKDKTIIGWLTTIKMSEERKEKENHWKRNLTVAIVIISGLLIIGFAIYTHLDGIQAHAEECKARYEALNSEPIWDQILNYAAYEQEWDDFRIECADVYKMP
jgi:hypothetical protein